VNSDVPRKEQVYLHLLLRKGQWVDGPELANEKVGGSEGLKRLRELRQEGEDGAGFRVEARKHPDTDRDIWQYRLVSAPAKRTTQTVPNGRVNEPPPHVQAPPQPYISPSSAGLPRLSDFMRKVEGGGFEIIKPLPEPPPEEPEPEQSSIPEPEQPHEARYTRDPGHLVFGRDILCPRCHNKTRMLKEQELRRDPFGKKNPRPCDRCNGWGLVPNQGPIPVQTPPLS
jgi:hypothetical protein